MWYCTTTYLQTYTVQIDRNTEEGAWSGAPLFNESLTQTFFVDAFEAPSVSIDILYSSVTCHMQQKKVSNSTSCESSVTIFPAQENRHSVWACAAGTLDTRWVSWVSKGITTSLSFHHTRGSRLPFALLFVLVLSPLHRSEHLHLEPYPYMSHATGSWTRCCSWGVRSLS